MNFLRQQNEDLLDQKVLGENKAEQLVETIKIAETVRERERERERSFYIHCILAN